MRIIAGQFKNRVIAAPQGKKQAAITEMVRESLFNILGSAVIDARFADLFAGSGSVGLEALSRGAWRVTFVEKKKRAADDIRKSLAQWNVDLDRARVWNSDVFQLGQHPSDWAEWDIAFLDPPPQTDDNFLDRLIANRTLNSGTTVIVHRPAENSPLPHSGALGLQDVRKYGRSVLYFYS